MIASLPCMTLHALYQASSQITGMVLKGLVKKKCMGNDFVPFGIKINLKSLHMHAFVHQTGIAEMNC